MPVRVLVIDDDALSREVLALLLHGAGFAAETVDSGDAALLHLQPPYQPPQVILADLQMPGISGNELARQLRALCGPATTLLAMSASVPDGGFIHTFDGFLLKPFTMETFAAAVAGKLVDKVKRHGETDPAVLDETIYRKFAGSMPPLRLEQLYHLCLTDVAARLAVMQRAASNRDDDKYKREAHAIKGGCGMVGAIELQTLATSMEEHGLRDDHVASFKQFLVACQRLRGMLIEREIIHDRASGVSGEDA